MASKKLGFPRNRTKTTLPMQVPARTFPPRSLERDPAVPKPIQPMRLWPTTNGSATTWQWENGENSTGPKEDPSKRDNSGLEKLHRD